MGREKLLNDLFSFSAASDEAAITLADLGDHSALPAILDSIARDCGWEVIPDRKIGAFVRLADVSTIPLLIALLDRLDEAELENDAGDIGDEFWRIQTAVRRILVGMGRQVVDSVRAALVATGNRFTRECLGQVLTELEPGPSA